MTDLTTLIAELRRPRLLLQAARHGLPDYNRSRDLLRLIRVGDTPTAEAALADLLAIEDRMERTRRAGAFSYSLGRHVDVLIAILAEARLLPKPAEPG